MKTPRPAHDFDGKLSDILRDVIDRPGSSPYRTANEFIRWEMIEDDIRAAHAGAMDELRGLHLDEVNHREHGGES